MSGAQSDLLRKFAKFIRMSLKILTILIACGGIKIHIFILSLSETHL